MRDLNDRAQFGQTLNGFEDAGARAAWLSLGGAAFTVGGAGLMRASTIANTGSTTAIYLGRTGACA